MTDEQFDALAKEALAFEAGPPREATWDLIKPMRWTWLPSVREILACGCVCALALVVVGLGISRKQESGSNPNTVIQGAIRDETRSILASVTRIDGTPQSGSKIGLD